MPAVFLDDLDKYLQTGGYKYDTISSGLVRFDLDPSLQIPYLWWTPKPYSHSTTSKWWNNIPGLTSEENLPYLEQIDFFKFIPKDLQHIPDQFYYLVVPHIEESRFSLPEIQQVAQDNIFKELDLSSYNPAASSHDTFKTLFSPDHRVYRRDIEPANLDIWDLINFLKESEELCHESMPATNNENCSTGDGNTGGGNTGGGNTGDGNTGGGNTGDGNTGGGETGGGETGGGETGGGETGGGNTGGGETGGGETGGGETGGGETGGGNTGGGNTGSDETGGGNTGSETGSETIGGETGGNTGSIPVNPVNPGDPQRVPEYSSILTIAIFGVVLCSRLFKRK